METELYLYIHFPFCRKKCKYCDFYSITDLSAIKAWFSALNQEIDLYDALLSTSRIKTLYIGGGSPNLMEAEQLFYFLNHLNKYNSLENLTELTLEINPGNISALKLMDFFSLGVNRISIGAQSFQDEELKFLGRIHNSREIIKTVQDVKSAGINNISLDMIFGIPGQTFQGWQNNLKQALSLKIDHFSFYNLIYEPGTPLTRLKNSNKFQIIDEDTEYEMYQYAHQFLKKAGYEHYEISNWSLPGRYSCHNSAYWLGKNYLGLGPAAHSFFNGERWSNIPSVEKYMDSLSKKESPVHFSEILSRENKIEEALLLGLRTAQGLSLSSFESLINLDFKTILISLEKKFNRQFLGKYAKIEKDFLRLTVEGWFICDYIIEQILTIIEECQ